MSLYFLDAVDMQSLADAIKAKGNISGTISFPDGFANAISNFHDLVLQSKTVTPTESVQVITPDSGYDGLSVVTMNAISSNYVGTGITRRAAATYTPSTTAQTIPAGVYLTGTQTINGDVNLVASNIKSGVTIFGVTGTCSLFDSVMYSIATKTITSLTLPISKVMSNAFKQCQSLSYVSLSKCCEIDASGFQHCYSLRTVYLDICSVLGSWCFQMCSNLQSLYLMSTSVANLVNSYTFRGTPISANGTGKVYVRASLVNAYKTAANWSIYSSFITGI